MSHFLENVLSAIDEDLGPFAERALRARLTTARVFTDKQIDIWGKVIKENDIKADSTGGADKKGPAGSFLCLYETACHFKNSSSFCAAEIDQDRPVEHPGVKVFYRPGADIHLEPIFVSFRRQSGITDIQLGCLKADIDYQKHAPTNVRVR